MFHHVRRRHSGIFILIGLSVLIGQYYFVLRKTTNQQFSEPETFLSQSPELPNKEVSELNDILRYANKRTRNLTTERYHVMESYANETSKDINAPFKRILFWNEAYGSKDYGVGLGPDALRKSGCPVWQCETSDDRRGAEDYDAVVFHLRSWRKDDLPARRLPHQRYVFWSIESAAWRYVDTNMMKNFFNWTMTYRWDSDMVAPYGYVKPLGDVPLHPSSDQMKEHLANMDTTVNYANGKTKMAAWFVSNCASHSKRNEMVRELKKYVDVDVYGDCGTKKCSREKEDECRKMVSRKYKFYLSLENSLCLDYVTEKFFGMMHYDIIPIVVGFHDHHEKIAPTHSFINIARFENIKKLADYMILLDKNDTLYNEYFWWKPHFNVQNTQQDFNQGMCHLCASLHNSTIPPKVYSDMAQWWDAKSSCKTPVVQ